MADVENSRGGEWPADAPQPEKNFGPPARPRRWGVNEGGGSIPSREVFDTSPNKPVILRVGEKDFPPEVQELLRQNPQEKK